MAGFYVDNAAAVAAKSGPSGRAEVDGTDERDIVFVEVNVPKKAYNAPDISTQGGDDLVYVDSGHVNVDTGDGNDHVTAHGRGPVDIELGAGDDDAFIGGGVKARIRVGPGDDTVHLQKDPVSQHIILDDDPDTVNTVTGFQPSSKGADGAYDDFADTITFKQPSDLWGLIDVEPVKVVEGTIPETGALVVFFNTESQGVGVAVEFPDIQASDVGGLNVQSYDGGTTLSVQVFGK